MKRVLLTAVGVFVLGASLALAGGQFTNQLPQQNTYGPLIGSETIPVDTNLPQGAQPQTISVPLAAVFLPSYTNKLIGGDFTTNPAQRLSTTKGIASVAGISPTAAVIGADRWWTVAPAAGVTLTIDSGTTAVVPGFNNTKAYRVARTSSGAAGIICTGQTLDKAASAPFIGQQAVFSFYEYNGAGMSATGGNFTVNIDYTSAADGAATQATLGYAGLNGSKFALADAGTVASGPTNYVQAINGIATGPNGVVLPGGSTVSGAPNQIAQFSGSASWTRYGVYASIPTNVPGTTTPVTSLSVSVCWTPTATTAIATDFIELEGLQLEVRPPASTVASGASGTLIGSTSLGPTSNPSATVPLVPVPSQFERRPAMTEQLLAYYYWYFNYENQSTITTVATCENTAATVANCLIPFPIPMRLAPAMQYTAGFQAFAQVAETSVSACSALAASASYATVSSTSGVLVACTASVGAAGTANQLTTLGTASATGIIVASAEP